MSDLPLVSPRIHLDDSLLELQCISLIKVFLFFLLKVKVYIFAPYEDMFIAKLVQRFAPSSFFKLIISNFAQEFTHASSCLIILKGLELME